MVEKGKDVRKACSAGATSPGPDPENNLMLSDNHRYTSDLLVSRQR